MTFRTWLRTIRTTLGPGGGRRGKTRPATARLGMESLTDRITPSFGYGGQFSLPYGEVATADFNDDGNPDLVSGSPLLVQLGDGQGGYSTPADFDYGTTINYPASPEVGDFTGDGIPDEVYAMISSGVYLRPGLGGGAYGTPVLTDITLGNCLAAADFNGDGRLDVVSATATMDFGALGSTWLGQGDGTFALSGDYFGLGMDVPQNIATGDFSGDGIPEVAIQGLGFDGLDAVTVLINAGDWNAPPPPPPPSISIGDRTVTEGHTGTVTATFTVTLSAASNQTVTVAYATASGTATAGSDFQATSGTLTFAPGETSKTISVPVYGDRLGEPDETFAVNLSGATNATLADGQGVGTVVDDEPRVSIGDVTQKEGNDKKTTVFTFTVTLAAAYDQPVTVRYATADGTATTSGGDYVAASGTITFAPGETAKSVTVVVKADARKEANETFYVYLFDDSGTSLFARSRGTGTILNDD